MIKKHLPLFHCHIPEHNLYACIQPAYSIGTNSIKAKKLAHEGFSCYVLNLNNIKPRNKRDKMQREHTLTAATTASPTTPGGAFHVPRPTEGIFAPVFRSKCKGPYVISLSMFSGIGFNARFRTHKSKEIK